MVVLLLLLLLLMLRLLLVLLLLDPEAGRIQSTYNPHTIVIQSAPTIV